MNPRVTTVIPHADYTLTLTFSNGEVRCFDVSPYLDKGIFKILREKAHFFSVRPVLGSIQWDGGQDLCPDTLYVDSIAVAPVAMSDVQRESARKAA